MRSVLLLVLLWGIGPCIPALIHGELIGMHHTDLFPALWSLWAWGMPQTSWAHTELLGYPDGMGWYPPSIARATVAKLVPFVSLPLLYNVFTLCSRVGSIVLSYWAARQWTCSPAGSFAAAVVFGCAPLLHGFSLEGIIEGQDAWTLPLWIGLIAKGSPVAVALSFALVVASSWYAAACGILLLCLILPFKRNALWSVFGLLLTTPLIHSFLQAWPGAEPFSPDIAQKMSLSIQAHQPFWIDTSMLALTGCTSLIAICVALKKSSVNILFLVPSVLLSLGLFHDLPVVNLMRFPYRWHLATLVVLCALLAPTIKDRFWLGWLIFAEQIFLSPLSPVLPHSKVSVPELYDSVDKPLLHIPGPCAQPAGKNNPSRRRASEFLLAQTHHQQPLINRGDFNGLESSSLSWWLTWDPLSQDPAVQPDRADLMDNTLILVHHGWLGRRGEKLEKKLEELGASEIGRDRLRTLWFVPPREE